MGGVTISTQANPQPTTAVAQALTSRVTQTCTAAQAVKQSTTCTLVATSCPNLSLACSNSANQTVSCKLDDAQNIGAAALAGEDPAGMLHALKITDVQATDPGAPAAIKQGIANALSETCFSQQTANQEEIANIICNASNSVDINVLSLVDQETACSMGVINGLAVSSREYVAQQYNAAHQQRVILYGSLFGAGVVLIAIILLLSIGFTGTPRVTSSAARPVVAVSATTAPAPPVVG